MRLVPALLLLFVTVSLLISNGPHVRSQEQRTGPAYRFAPQFTLDEVLHTQNRAQVFTRRYLQQEAEFFDLARHPLTGITYDGVNLDAVTGQMAGTRWHSAASKESLDLGLLLKAIEGDTQATWVVGRGDAARAAREALHILGAKLESYEAFARQFPGYGGFLPWFAQNAAGEMRPLDELDPHVPGLDNGEWLWSLLLTEKILRDHGEYALAEGYGAFNRALQTHAAEIFFDRATEKVAGWVRISDPRRADSPREIQAHLSGEHGVHEGVMMVLYMSLFAEGLPAGAAERMWSEIKMTRMEHPHGTTWQGFWGSSHESWAYLFLPLRDLEGYRSLFRIREAIRTHNAVERGYPGLASSIGAPGAGFTGGYLSAAGIEGIGSQAVHHNDVYAFYGAFPLLLQYSAGDDSRNVGLAWLLNMLHAQKAQGPLGGGESGRNDGRAIAPMKTIDGSFPLLLAMMGGLERECAELLRELGRYEHFISLMQREYDEAFGDAPLREPSFAIPPTAKVPVAMDDYRSDEVPVSVAVAERAR